MHIIFWKRAKHRANLPCARSTTMIDSPTMTVGQTKGLSQVVLAQDDTRKIFNS